MSGNSPGAEPRQAEPACWSCGEPVAARAMFCHACGRLQPPRIDAKGGDDAFARLGLPRRFDVDPVAIDRQHAGFSQRLAAERFLDRRVEEQRHAARHRAALDEARAVLADPWQRALHLLALAGEKVPGSAADAGVRDLSPAASLARATLAEAARPDEVEPLIDALDERLDDLFADLTAAFRAGDLAEAADLAAEIDRQRSLMAEARLRRSELRAR